jgi:predicted Fe-Mo cluster-binding NifX family protein
MRIAIPMADGMLAQHFGHCDKFILIDVNTAEKTIIDTDVVDAPPHQPGMLPGWLAAKGAEVIIAGGMGQRAQSLFAQQGIKVVIGAGSDKPEKIVSAFLDGNLKTGENICDH